ncbi:MAG: hypothetical protein QXP36_13810 [Conexivisphaerales archaeon]
MKEKIDFEKCSKELYSAVISDVLDDLGVYDHTISLDFKPLRNNNHLFGILRTIEFVNVEDVNKEQISGNPYTLTIKFFDSLKPHEVPFVFARDLKSGVMGELLSTRAKFNGSPGAIVVGSIRDRDRIPDDFNIFFSEPPNPNDAKGRIEARSIDSEIRWKNIVIRPKDYIYGDSDGVVIIPQNLVAEVLTRAFKKRNKEIEIKSLLSKGVSLEDVWKKYNIL